VLDLEGDLHLYQPAMYRVPGMPWRSSFWAAINDCGSSLTWDVGALLAIIGQGYPLGDRTLVREIQRRPWLSRLEDSTDPALLDIPSHGRYWLDPDTAARHLHQRLLNEIRRVCANHDQIYLLVSGGLDSRVVAAVAAELVRERSISRPPVAVTWGVKDCRDVRYGQLLANLLGFDWIHLPMSEEDLRENILSFAPESGALQSPIHFHRVPWLKHLPQADVVLAASYGDSVGRAEYSGFHVLGLPPLAPCNSFGLLSRHQVTRAHDLVCDDIISLSHRSQKAEAPYAKREHERTAYYMRNMLAHVMCSAEQQCHIYQVFTAPEVYRFMWSIHPSARGDEIYAALLDIMDSRLLSLPWARTDQALRGRTVGRVNGLQRDFHEYPSWISHALLQDISRLAEPEWCDASGVLDGLAVKHLIENVAADPYARGRHSFLPHERLAWLASLRVMANRIGETGRTVSTPPDDEYEWPNESGGIDHGSAKFQELRRALLNVAAMRPVQRRLMVARRSYLRWMAIRKYPPIPWEATS
jgi:hypothetical protein